MKILIKSSNAHKNRGIGFYTKNLIECLSKIRDIDLIESSKEALPDLIHYTYFDLYSPPLFIDQKIPTVVTIHDLTPIVFSKHYPAGLKGQFNNYLQRLSLRNVKAILTDSLSSKIDLVKYWNIPEEKIFITPLGIASHFKVIKDQRRLEQVQAKFNLPKRFVIFTGNVNWNKNILGMAKACIESEIDLVIAGESFTSRANLDHTELASFKEFLEKYEQHQRIHILGFVSDDDLVALYNLAEATLLLSFYEGFGLTILESQACGTPVITSFTSSMPEVGKDAVLYVDPYRVEDIRKAIQKILTDQNLRDRLVEKGFENTQYFDWENTAKATYQVYKKVLNGN